MKKTVFTFGLIGGAIMAAMMFATLPFVDKIGFERNRWLHDDDPRVYAGVLWRSLVSRKCERRPHNIRSGLRGGNSNHAGRLCLLCRCLGDHLLQIHAGLCRQIRQLRD